jgi:hypothetical protein
MSNMSPIQASAGRLTVRLTTTTRDSGGGAYVATTGLNSHAYPGSVTPGSLIANSTIGANGAAHNGGGVDCAGTKCTRVARYQKRGCEMSHQDLIEVPEIEVVGQRAGHLHKQDCRSLFFSKFISWTEGFWALTRCAPVTAPSLPYPVGWSHSYQSWS